MANDFFVGSPAVLAGNALSGDKNGIIGTDFISRWVRPGEKGAKDSGETLF